MISRAEKKFKDNVHGYISIPEEYVDLFIDTDLFQRLRSIEQTGMRILYPSARHDRFIHSLGVYHLGHKAFQSFRDNVKTSYVDRYYRVFDDEQKNEEFWDGCQLLFEIACLLHDCGHAPFSHTLEYVYTIVPKNEIGLTERLKKQCNSRGFLDDYQGEGSPHELMSALLACTEYGNAIQTVLRNHNVSCFRESDAQEFIVRMIIGFQYKQKDKEYQIRNCLVSLLNSKSIDVDSLDYIIRDTKMSGISNMSIDVDRLLSSLTLVEITDVKDIKVVDREISTVVWDGHLRKFDDRQAEYSGKISGRLEAGKNCIAEDIQGTVDIEANVVVTKACEFQSSQSIRKKISLNGTNLQELTKTESSGSFVLQGILNGELGLSGEKIAFRQGTNARVRNIAADEITFSSANIDGRMTGIFSGSFLGKFEAGSHAVNASTHCELGFHKSSLSIIQNVILARNYEYQWIYSHHKVVYYANYLEIELLRQCIRFLLKKEQERTGTQARLHASDEMQKILSWKTMASMKDEGCRPYEAAGMKFWRPTDSDILSIFKRVQIEATDKDEVYKYIKEYTTRKYRKSLWKSYAEMHNFLRRFTQEDVRMLLEILVNCSSLRDGDTNDSKDVGEDEVASRENEKGYRLNKQYGYPDRSWQNNFERFGLSDVVWVNGDSKLKTLDPNLTFIHFKNTDMTYGSVSSPNDIHSISNLNLFYLYYRPIEGMEIDKEGLLNYFR